MSSAVSGVHKPDAIPSTTTSIGANAGDSKPVQRTASGSSYSQEKVPADAEKGVADPPTYDRANDDGDDEVEESRAARTAFWGQYRPFILAGVALVILGWWISATILKATRHRW